MKKKRLLLAACFLSAASVAMAQSRVTGTVVSGDDGLPIVGASVIIPGTKVGVMTDVNGKFTLRMPEGKKDIRISYLGMEPQMVTARENLQVVLKSDSKALNEVVVTAMGLKRSEKALGYSATSISGDQIAQKQTTDIMSSLSGQVAGVQISSTSSDPGASNSVVIRGFSSLSGSNQPLYVIDGVPMDNTSVANIKDDPLNDSYDFGNGSNAINPEDVENLTILKGAAATALYGSRAAGGVVMITTKSGKKGKGVGIEYNGGVQWETLLRLPQMQNEFGMGWYGDKTDIENGSWGPRFDGTTQVFGNIYDHSQKIKSYVALKDNIKDFFDTGFRYNNSISFNGATDRSNYYVSFGQVHDDGIIPTDADSYKRYTFTAKGSHTVGKLTFSSTLNYVYQDNSFAAAGQGLSMYNSIMQTPRDISIIGMKDLSDPFNTPGYYYTPYGVTNPYYILENYENKYNAERFYGKFQMDYSFLEYFKFTYRFGLDTSTGEQKRGEPNLYALFYKGTPNGEGQGSGSPFNGATGSVEDNITRRREINQDIMLTFSKPFDDFNVNALVGFNGNERKLEWLYTKITDLTIPTWYNLSNTAKAPTTSTYNSLRRLMGVYGQVEASWKDMVYLTVNMRNDWSSTLPKDNRSFFYPGVTASFIFSELLPDNWKKILTFGKLRAAWGRTGNDAAPYMINPVYGQATGRGYWGDYKFPFVSKGYNAYTLGNVLGSNTLSPEMTTESELGLNLVFFDNRISIDAAYYNRISDKQIYSLNMDYASGFTAQNTNLGEIRNRGVELLVNVTPVKTRDFTWTVGWNFTKNWSKVLSLPEQLGGQALIWGFQGGTSLYAMVGQPLGVYTAVVPERTADGKIVANASTGLPVAASGNKIVGDMNYKYQMGLNTSLSYKGVTLSASLDIRKGGLMYSRTKSITYFTGNAMQTAYNDRNPFIIPNSVNAVTNEDGTTSYVENTTPIDKSKIYDYWNNGGSDLDAGFLIDKSYVKLRSVVLSWDVPAKWLHKTFIKGLRVSAFGNNLFVWTPSGNTFVDPEQTSFGNDLEGNFGEYSANPSSRRFGFNLMVKF